MYNNAKNLRQRPFGAYISNNSFSLIKLGAIIALASATFLARETNAFAQTFDVGVRSAAMGDTATAVSRASDALANNPSAIAGTGSYDIEAGYIYKPNSHILNASVVDAKTNPKIPAGVAYSFIYGTNKLEGIYGHNVRAGIAVPLLGPYLSLGISGNYSWLFQNIGAKEDLEVARGFNMSAGLRSTFFNMLSIGFSANNFIPLCKKDICKTFFPLTFNTGVGFSIADFTLATDVDVVLKRTDKAVLDIGVGAEYVIMHMLPIRLGYRRVGFYNKNLITAGLGYSATSFNVNISYQGDVSHKGDHSIFANIGVKL